MMLLSMLQLLRKNSLMNIKNYFVMYKRIYTPRLGISSGHMITGFSFLIVVCFSISSSVRAGLVAINVFCRHFGIVITNHRCMVRFLIAGYRFSFFKHSTENLTKVTKNTRISLHTSKKSYTKL